MATWDAPFNIIRRMDLTSCAPTTTTITPSTTGTEGTWVDLLSSTMARDGHFIQIGWDQWNTSATARQNVLDIGLNVGGTRYVVIRELNVAGAYKSATTAATTTTAASPQLFVPCFVPSGANVSARSRGNAATTNTITCQVVSCPSMYGMGSYAAIRPGPDTHLDSYGNDTTNRQGAVVTPNASADTFGTAVVIGGTTNYPYDGFVIGYGGNGSAAITTAAAYRIQLTGVAGSPVYYDNILGTVTTSEQWAHQWPADRVAWLRKTLPAGTQIYARCMSSIASGTTITLSLHGIRK